jgi:hypothetical protein
MELNFLREFQGKVVARALLCAGALKYFGNSRISEVV